MSLSVRLGLRTQIILALSVVFLLSFALLGTATLRLTQAAGEVEQARAARLTADVLSTGFASADDEQGRVATLDALVARTNVIAARLSQPGRAELSRGQPPDRPGVRAKLPGGGELTIWLERAPARTHLPLGNLLLFYVALTGLAVLMLAYFALTHLIVRPLDQLTRSSEALAAGTQEVRVPETGAAEAARLAASFNAMAAQLRAERRALEQRLEELEATTVELRTTQQQLIHGEKLASVGRLAAGVAHEIGNPLAAILGLTELLRAGGLDEEESHEFLERIHRETERINAIIRDLLAFSRRDPEGDGPGQTADLARVVEDAVNLVRPQKESRGVTIDVQLAGELGRVQGPQHRLTQVVLNLLLNAIDALDGEGRVLISTRVTDDGRCALRVDDDGPGIDGEVIEHIFEPFMTTKPPGKGTGLGLAVCHALVEAMGGSITVENRQGGGARFEVLLQRVQPGAQLKG
jgi:signal transduction histidine kinase